MVSDDAPGAAAGAAGEFAGGMAHIPASIVQHPIADLDEVAVENQDSHCLESMRICGAASARGPSEGWGKPDQWQYNIPGDIAAPQFLMLPEVGWLMWGCR
jgi:hypothetical protein